MAEQFHRFYKLGPRSPTALNTKGQHAARPFWQIFLGNLVIRMAFQAWIIHPFHRFMSGQEIRHNTGIGDMLLHTQGQGFDPLQQIERAGRAQHRAKVPQPFRPGTGNKASRAIFFRKDNAMIGGVRLGQGREFLRLGEPIEAPGINQGTPHRNTMPPQPFRCRMHNDIRTMINGATQIGRVECAIDHQRQAMAMGDIGHGLNIQNFQVGIAQNFCKNQPGFRPDRGFKFFRLARIDKGRGNPEPGQRVQEHVDRSAIQRFRCNDVPALTHQG